MKLRIIAVNRINNQLAGIIRFNSGNECPLESFSDKDSTSEYKRQILDTGKYISYQAFLLLNHERNVQKLNLPKVSEHFRETQLHACFPLEWHELGVILYGLKLSLFIEEDTPRPDLLTEHFSEEPRKEWHQKQRLLEEARISIKEKPRYASKPYHWRKEPSLMRKSIMSSLWQATGKQQSKVLFSLKGYNRELKVLEWETPYLITSMDVKGLFKNGYLIDAIDYSEFINGSVDEISAPIPVDKIHRSYLGDFSPTNIRFLKDKYRLDISLKHKS